MQGHCGIELWKDVCGIVLPISGQAFGWCLRRGKVSRIVSRLLRGNGMSKERVEQVEGAGASVPMTDISNIDVPEGTDELSRSTRRAWRERLNLSLIHI